MSELFNMLPSLLIKNSKKMLKRVIEGRHFCLTLTDTLSQSANLPPIVTAHLEFLKIYLGL